jgi:hypothetical protein
MKTLALFLLLYVPGLVCCSNSNTSTGTSNAQPVGSVSPFATKSAILGATGATIVNITDILPTEDGPFLIQDSVSDSILVLSTNGTVQIFTTEDEITNLTGETNAELEPLDRLFLGTYDGEFVAADEVSGTVIRIDIDGVPVIHTTVLQVTTVTGETSAQAHLPRHFDTNLILFQDLQTRDLIVVGNSGDPLGRVPSTEVSAAAGLSSVEAVVAQWVRGDSTGDLFGRFERGNHIVKMSRSGILTRHVDGSELAALFPEIVNLSISMIFADLFSDGLLVLVKNGSRGAAIALIDENGGAAAFTFPDELEAAAGLGYNLVDIGMLTDGTPFGIDAGNDQVFLFSVEGVPLILGASSQIQNGSGTNSPALSVGAGLFSEAVIVFEQNLGNMLRVE